jgi:hypothetical protein
MRAVENQGGPVHLVVVLMSRARHSRHVELALRAGKTIIIATSRQPTLVDAYLQTYLSSLECWLRN